MPTTVNQQFIEDNGLVEKIPGMLQQLNIENADKIAQQLEELILGGEFSDSLRQLIADSYSGLLGKRVAVRSSGSEEDGAQHSFAGQHSSFLNVRGVTQVFDSIKACWASAYSHSSLTYRLQHQLPIGIVNMACIIQQMVDSEKSGVAFTANPLNHRRDELVISAAYGLGEGIVSGAIDADTLVVDRIGNKVKETVIGMKESIYSYSKSKNENIILESTDEQQQALCLLGNEVSLLIEQCELIESLFTKPQDIEWAFVGSDLYFLQTRDITNLRPERGRIPELTLWDNSNIVESYGDITLPLTASFAKHVYHQVFREHAHLLGARHHPLNKMDTWNRNMLAYHNGRVYYNLLNWYRMIGLVPFADLHRAAFELSIGVEPLDRSRYESISPYESFSTFETVTTRIGSSIMFWYHFFTVELNIRRFLDQFYRLHRVCDAKDYKEMKIETSFAQFRTYKEEFLKRWGHTILLENCISLSLGSLMILTKKWLPEAPSYFLMEMTKPQNSVESVEPVERMASIASHIREKTDLKILIENTPSEEIYTRLSGSSNPEQIELLEQVDQYIAEFGYRSANELKLEEPDMRESPAIFFSMLKGAVAVTANAHGGTKNVNAIEAEEYFENNLGVFKKLVYKVIRAKVRKSLAARERVRFCRTKAFGTCRKMLKGIAANMEQFGILKDSHDIFYLKLEELEGWFDGNIGQDEILGNIETRKNLFDSYSAYDAPGRFETKGLISREDYFNNGWMHSSDIVLELASEGQVLKGTPSCPGVVEAEAMVIDTPVDVQGKILVTYRVDPGWCPVLNSAKALLIERGSPLTHVAIVAREMGIPTVMQVKDLTRKIQSGMKLRVDGKLGLVEIKS